MQDNGIEEIPSNDRYSNKTSFIPSTAKAKALLGLELGAGVSLLGVAAFGAYLYKNFYMNTFIPPAPSITGITGIKRIVIVSETHRPVPSNDDADGITHTYSTDKNISLDNDYKLSFCVTNNIKNPNTLYFREPTALIKIKDDGSAFSDEGCLFLKKITVNSENRIEYKTMDLTPIETQELCQLKSHYFMYIYENGNPIAITDNTSGRGNNSQAFARANNKNELVFFGKDNTQWTLKVKPSLKLVKESVTVLN